MNMVAAAYRPLWRGVNGGRDARLHGEIGSIGAENQRGV
jgi:hypothetical protein